jgi:acyl carrier protein
MTTLNDVQDILRSTLQLGERAHALTPTTPLLDDLPEFDSMAVVTVITALEERFDITFDDEELSAEHFQTVGSLVSFVDSKVQ